MCGFTGTMWSAMTVGARDLRKKRTGNTSLPVALGCDKRLLGSRPFARLLAACPPPDVVARNDDERESQPAFSMAKLSASP